MNWNRILHIFIYLFAAIGLFLTGGYLLVRFGFTNDPGIIDDRSLVATTTPTWAETEEWNTLRQAVIKDKEQIDRVSLETGVDSRTIVSLLIVEQLRLFNDDRESYKKFFEPLKMLGPQSIFSWGVMGIKKETAIEVENNLKDPSSPRYPGERFEHDLDFSSDSIEDERYQRLIDQHDHYYPYLYTALFIREIQAEWNKAGFPIGNRPEIYATLYNLGFAHSDPKPDPKVGGAAIPINGRTYSFGSLAYEFYYSGELLGEFPRK